MERIYFDKQIFSHLFNGVDPVYQNLLEAILQNRDDFLFCYSHAHLLDLKNDLTNKKYDELDFMETIVRDNYLQYADSEKSTSCYLAKPGEAFRSIDWNDSFPSLASLFDGIDLSLATQEQKDKLDQANKMLNTKLDFGFPGADVLPEDIAAQLGKILPPAGSSLMDWAEHFMGLTKLMEEDKNVYKGLRGMIDKYINNGKFTVDYDKIDFNDDLKNSELKKSFMDFVHQNLDPNGTRDLSNYDFFVNAYFSLDVLGISKERSKTVKFRNVINDGIHAYYGAYCDYVVSDDDGFLKKTRAMYRLLNIHTKVYHIDEFIGHFSLLSRSAEPDASAFFQLLAHDFQNGIVQGQKPSLRFNRQTTTIKPYHTYLGYFNRLELVKEDGHDFALLTRVSDNYSWFGFLREYEGIVNKAVKLFGPDNDFKERYVWPDENAAIKEEQWEGRLWDWGGIRMFLEINKGTRKLTLLITTNGNKES